MISHEQLGAFFKFVITLLAIVAVFGFLVVEAIKATAQEFLASLSSTQGDAQAVAESMDSGSVFDF
jgi:hypothetical protein